MSRRLIVLSAAFILIKAALCLEVRAEVLMTKGAALKELLPQAEEITPTLITLSNKQKKKIEQEADLILSGEHGSEFQFYIGYSGGKIIGYAAEDTVAGKWGPIHYMAGITPQGSVSNIIILEYKERRGRPVAKKRFLKQYFGKTIQNPIRLRKDIDGVTGATISSRGITDGVRKLLYIFEEFFKS